jgi:hypothetical protein
MLYMKNVCAMHARSFEHLGKRLEERTGGVRASDRPCRADGSKLRSRCSDASKARLHSDAKSAARRSNRHVKSARTIRREELHRVARSRSARKTLPDMTSRHRRRSSASATTTGWPCGSVKACPCWSSQAMTPERIIAGSRRRSLDLCTVAAAIAHAPCGGNLRRAIAALRESESGTSRQFAAMHPFDSSRWQSEHNIVIV